MFRSFIEFLSAPAFLVDGQGQTVATNSAARRILDEGTLVTRGASGEPRFIQIRAERKLAEAMALVRKSLALEPGRNQATSFLVDADEATPRMMVHVMGLGGAPDHVVILLPMLVSHQDAERLSRVLISLYALTPAEARLGAAMLKGHTSGADLAKALNRSEWTVRSQIRTLFTKLDVSTKTEAINRMSLEVLPMNIDYCSFRR